MRLVLVAVLALAGCYVPPSKHRAAVGPEPKFSVQVRTWLEAVDLGIDCPMSLEEARGLRSIAQEREREGDVAVVMGHVACLCDVTTRYKTLDFDPTCKLQPQPAYYHARSRDERRMLEWHNALVDKIRSGTAPDMLSRSTPITKQLKELKKKSPRG